MSSRNEVATNAMKTQTFNNDMFGDLTVVMVKDKPWFLAKEVADKLEYSETASMTKGIRDKYLGKIEPSLKDDWLKQRGLKDNGGKLPTIINEFGIIQAVLKSRKPEAERFQDWVIEEVIPSIMKTGSYSMKPLSKIEQYEQLLELAKAEEAQRIENEKKERSINQGYKSVIGRKTSIINKSKDALGVTRDKDVPVAIREELNKDKKSISYKQLAEMFNTTVGSIKQTMVDCGIAQWGGRYDTESDSVYKVIEATSDGTKYSSYYTYDGSPRVRWNEDIIEIIRDYLG